MTKKLPALALPDDVSYGTYALLDCALLPHTIHRTLRKDETVHYKSLFDGTPDESSAMSGPVLMKVISEEESKVVQELLGLQVEQPAVIWLWSEREFDELYGLLQSMLYVNMPDGKLALCRFYDPRCLKDMLRFFKLKGFYTKLKAIRMWAYWKCEGYSWVGNAGI